MFSLRRKSDPKRPDVELEKPKTARRRLSFKQITDLRTDAQKRQPGPSKLMYRLARSWKKPWLRKITIIGLPTVMFLVIAGRLAMDPVIQQSASDARSFVVTKLSERPVFAVRAYRIDGAGPELVAEIEDVLALEPGASSLTIDVAAIQRDISAIPSVRRAHVHLDPGGTLRIDVSERLAAALWRDDTGQLWRMDREGVALGAVSARAAYPRLPVVVGGGAPEAMEEALTLFKSAPDLHPRIRAMVRVGQRRWDVVLDGSLTIMLPEDAPVEALARAMALHYGDELMDRDLLAIDMRIAARPTLRLHADALETWRLLQVAQSGEDT
jgi:cell division protein FtsQ